MSREDLRDEVRRVLDADDGGGQGELDVGDLGGRSFRSVRSAKGRATSRGIGERAT